MFYVAGGGGPEGLVKNVPSASASEAAKEEKEGVGMVDMVRIVLRLPETKDDEEEDDLPGVSSDAYGSYGAVAGGGAASGSHVVYRQFASSGYGEREGDREWV